MPSKERKAKAKNASPTTHQVHLDGNVDVDSIEATVKRSYAASFAAGTNEIVFDLRKCHFLHPYALSVFVSWAARLRRLNRSVVVERPSDPDVNWFLEQYDVYGFLRSRGVAVPHAQRPGGSVQPPRGAEPFYKLADIDEQQLEQTLNDLSDANRMRSVFSPIATSALVRSGEIRDVILAELGDNIVKHAGSIGGHVFMTKFAARSRLTFGGNIENAGEALERFERRLDGGQYVVVVVGDAGDGIPETLREAYKKDPDHVGQPEPTDAQILNYAFQYASTRRSPEERLGAIRNAISNESKRFPPPTGLFRVRDLTKRAFGTILVRSGTAAILLEYRPPLGAEEVIAFDNLSPYAGTTIAVFIPLSLPDIRHSEAVIADSETRPQPITMVALHNHIQAAASLDLDGSANVLHSLFEALKQIRGGDPPHEIVVNLKAATLISPKASHYVIFEFAQRQIAGYAVVLVQVPASLVSDAITALASQRYQIHPIIAFDDHYIPHLIGAREDCERVFNRIRKNEPLSDADAAVAREHRTIFVFGTGGRWLLRFGEHNIREIESKSLKSTLAGEIIRTFRADAKVLLPSAAYADGFFELAPRLREPSFFALVTEWLLTLLPDIRPDVVISVGANCAAIIDAVVPELGWRPKHVRASLTRRLLVSTSAIIDFVGEQASHKQNQTYAVFADVIATGKTIGRVLQAIGTTTNVHVITLVDTRHDTDDTLSGCAITKVVIRPIAHYHDEPPRTWLYSDVRLVDPFTHALLPARATDGPLWQSSEAPQPDRKHQTNAFLDEVVVPAAAFRIGHFATSERHLTFIFDVARIGEVFRSEMAERIHTYISDRITIRGTPITHVILPQGSRASEIARAVGGRAWRTQVLEITPEELRTPFGPTGKALPGAGSFLVCDAVFDSGKTISRLVEIATARGAQYVEVIAIIGRGNQDRIRRLQKVTRYERAEVDFRCVGEIELPTYSPSECPPCHYRRTWANLMPHTSEGSFLRRLILREMHALDPRSIDQAWMDATHAEQNPAAANRDALRLHYRWRLETAARYPLEIDYLLAILTTHTEYALALMNVIVRERLYLRRPYEIRSIVFPDRLVAKIRSFIEWMIKHAAKLWIDDFQTLLLAIDDFQDADAPDGYLRVASVTQGDSTRLELLILHFVRSGWCQAVPLSSKERLEAFPLHTPELHQLRIEAIASLEGIQKSRERQLESGLTATRDLLEGLFHDLPHRLSLLRTSVMADDPHVLVNDFAYLKDRLALILGNSRTAARACYSRDTQAHLEDLIKTAEADLRYADGIVSRLRAHNSNDAAAVAGLRQTAEILVERCRELHEELTHLAVPLDELLPMAINVHRPLILQRNTDFDETPIPPCWVYGERGPVFSAISNLLKNAAVYCDKAIRIEVLRNREEKTINVFVMNDGKPLPVPVIFRRGLKDVAETAQRYAITFDLSNIPRNDRARRRRYAILASLQFNEISIGG